MLNDVSRKLITPEERFWEEKAALMPLEQPKVARVREETRKVDRSGLIRIDGLSYRVPDYLVKSRFSSTTNRLWYSVKEPMPSNWIRHTQYIRPASRISFRKNQSLTISRSTQNTGAILSSVLYLTTMN